MSDSPARPTFSSAFAAVCATAGVAIGLGNIWRFPYLMGQHGGAVFLLLYLVIVAAFGLPVLMAEWALGRHTRRGPWQAFERAGLRGGRFFSVIILVTVVMASSYYGAILASVLYLTIAYSGGLACGGSDAAIAISQYFPTKLAFLMGTVVLGCCTVAFGVKTGIERVSKLALPLFFGLFVVLIVRSLTLDGAGEGLRALFLPRWENFTPTTPLAALGQAMFSLGVGGSFMIAYGSYMREREDIPRIAIWTATADVAAALMAGLIIFPAAFALGVPVDGGPALLFRVMPEIFRQMPLGDLFGAIFFGSVFVVALLSLVAAYEVIVAALGDGLGWSRRRALVAVGLSQMVLSVPALLSNGYIGFSDLIWGTTMQPVGAVIAVIALAWCIGTRRALEELRRNSRLPVPVWLFHWNKYGIPVGIVGTLIYGWASR